MFPSQLPQSRNSIFRKGKVAFLLVGVLAGVTVGGGVGVFAASTSKTVTVCVDKNDQHMHYRKSGKCLPHQLTVVLNQRGADGATGATGPAGVAGAKGDTGAAGTNGTNATVAIAQQFVCDGNDADTVANELCKIGMTGPGGGIIFFVDYNDQHAGLDYLEAAPASCEGTVKTWSSDTTNSLVAVNGWAARAVGRGQANTTAMMTNNGSYVADTSGAAFFADSLICGGKSDWFLGSLGEVKMMYDNLQGFGDFAGNVYWSSTGYDNISAWAAPFEEGAQYYYRKNNANFVRPVRSF